MQERFTKDLKEIKNSQYIMNNAINEIKNTLEGTKNRIKEAEDNISEVEDRNNYRIHTLFSRSEHFSLSIFCIYEHLFNELMGSVFVDSFAFQMALESDNQRQQVEKMIIVRKKGGNSMFL